MSSTVEEQVSELKRSLTKLREESNDDVLDPDDPEVVTIVQKLESLQKQHPDEITVYISDESREWLCQYYKDNYPFAKPDFPWAEKIFGDVARLDPPEIDVLRDIYEAVNGGNPSVPDESDVPPSNIGDQKVESDIKEKWNETTRFDLSRGEFVRDQNEGCGRVKEMFVSPMAAVNMTLPTSIEKLTSLESLSLSTPCKSFWSLNPTFFPSIMASMSQLSKITYFINLDFEDDIPASDEVTVANSHYHPPSDIFPNIQCVDIIDCVEPRRSGGERGEEQFDIDDQILHFVMYQCPNLKTMDLVDTTSASIDRLLFETSEWTTNPSNSVMNGPREENELVVKPPLYYLEELHVTNLSEDRVQTILCDKNWYSRFPFLKEIHVYHTDIQTLQPIALRLAGLSAPSLLPKPKPLSALQTMKRSFRLDDLSFFGTERILTQGPAMTRQKEIDALIVIIQHLGIERMSEMRWAPVDQNEGGEEEHNDDDGNDEQDDNIDANEGEDENNDGEDYDDDDDDYDEDEDEDEDGDEQYDEIDLDEYNVDDDATANDDDASTDTTTTSSSSEKSLYPKIQPFLELNIAARMWKKMNIDDDDDENVCKNDNIEPEQTKSKNSPVVYWEYLLEKNSNSPTVLHSLLCATSDDIVKRQETSRMKSKDAVDGKLDNRHAKRARCG